MDDEALPEDLDTPEMRQAMGTLRQFSEKERAYHLYQSRLDYIRVQKTLQRSKEEAERKAQEAERKLAEARQSEEAAVKEKERLARLLREAGIGPD